MGVIKQEFVSDTSQYEAKLAKMQAEVLKLKERLKEVTQETHRGTAAFGGWAGSQASAIFSMAAGFASVTTVIAAVARGIGAVNQELTDVANKARDLRSGMATGMGQIGQLASAHKGVAFARQAVVTGAIPATREQIQAAYLGAAGGLRGGTETEKRAVAGRAAMMSPILQTPEAIQNYSEMLARVKRIMPGRTVEEASSLLTGVQQRLGKDAAQVLEPSALGGVQALIERGTSAEMAMGTAAAMVEHGQSVARLRMFAKKGMRVTDPRAKKLLGVTPAQIRETAAGLETAVEGGAFEKEMATPAYQQEALESEHKRRIDVLNMNQERAAAIRRGEEKEYEAATIGADALKRGALYSGKQLSHAKEALRLDFSGSQFRKASESVFGDPHGDFANAVLAELKKTNAGINNTQATAAASNAREQGTE